MNCPGCDKPMESKNVKSSLEFPEGEVDIVQEVWCCECGEMLTDGSQELVRQAAIDGFKAGYKQGWDDASGMFQQLVERSRK